MRFPNWFIRVDNQRFLHLSHVLRQPRNFKARPIDRTPRVPIDNIDRAQIKENVNSLYATSWDTVYHRDELDVSSDVKVIDTASKATIEVSLSDVMGFLRNESSGPIDSFGSSEHGMVIAEIDSGRGRQNIGDSLIRRFKHLFENHQVRREGLDRDSDWMVVDLGNIFVHIMSPEARKEYNLEAAWTAARSGSEVDSDMLARTLKPKSFSQDPTNLDYHVEDKSES